LITRRRWVEFSAGIVSAPIYLWERDYLEWQFLAVRWLGLADQLCQDIHMMLKISLIEFLPRSVNDENDVFQVWISNPPRVRPGENLPNIGETKRSK
jgi:hypothetical protein